MAQMTNLPHKRQSVIQRVRRSFLSIFSFLWILFSPITFGAFFPVAIALFITKNQFVVCMSYIIYAGLWFWINDSYLKDKDWFL